MNKIVKWEWINQGWEFYKEEFFNIFLLCLIANIIIWAVSAFTYGFGGIIIRGPIYCGIYIALFQKMTTGEKVDISMLTEGFRQFIPIFIASLIISIFVAFGMILCIIPGLIIASMYMFTYPLIVQKHLNFWDAMEESRNLIFKDLITFTIFHTIILLIALSGIIGCFVGIFFSLPLYFCIIAVVYKELYGLQ